MDIFIHIANINCYNPMWKHQYIFIHISNINLSVVGILSIHTQSKMPHLHERLPMQKRWIHAEILHTYNSILRDSQIRAHMDSINFWIDEMLLWCGATTIRIQQIYGSVIMQFTLPFHKLLLLHTFITALNDPMNAKWCI